MDAELNKHFQRHLPHVHWQRFEPTGEIGSGVPDLNGCCAGIEFWLELKRVNGWRVKVRPMQVAWALRRVRVGGRVLVAARHPVRGLWLLRPNQLLATTSLRELPGIYIVLQCPGLPAAWNWGEICNAIGIPRTQ